MPNQCRWFLLAFILVGAALFAEISLPVPSKAAGRRQATGKNASSSELVRGRWLFMRDCAHCHGRSGDGNSPVRQSLHPAPLSLTAFDLTESFVLHLLREGVPGSDMPAWHVSPEEDLHAVSAYTARLGHRDELLEGDRFSTPEALEEAGRRIYAMHCIRCHGERGAGDGKDAAQYLPKPPTFQGMRPSYAAAKRLIEGGVPGTAMAAWPLLTEPEIQAVTYYIRSLYPGDRQESSQVLGAVR